MVLYENYNVNCKRQHHLLVMPRLQIAGNYVCRLLRGWPVGFRNAESVSVIVEYSGKHIRKHKYVENEQLQCVMVSSQSKLIGLISTFQISSSLQSFQTVKKMENKSLLVYHHSELYFLLGSATKILKFSFCPYNLIGTHWRSLQSVLVCEGRLVQCVV